MNKEFNRMLKLAGLMTEGLYTAQMYSEEPVKEAPMSRMTKKKLKAKIKEMMTPMPDEDTNGTDDYYDADYDGSYSDGYIDDIDHEFDLGLDEVGGIEENASDISSSIPKSSVELLISAAKRIIGALKDGGFEQEDIYDYIMDKVKTLSVDEALFEAKKEEEEAPEGVNIDVEAPVEDTADTANTAVDINMDGTPDLDTGSPEFKKAFTTLIDAYNAAKEIGDPKYTQMLANAVTYFNKNMILKPGQPQA